MSTSRQSLRLGVAATALLVWLGCRPSPPPNVLLVSVDTLRADSLSYAGNARRTSPNLDQLVPEARIFTDCRSVSGWTLPSMATVLSGRYPKGHGATRFSLSMAEGVPTLATMLAERGYENRAFVSHVFLKPKHGFAEGFSSYDTSVLRGGHPHNVSTAKKLTNRALKALEEVNEPFFYWLHYFDPHSQYLAHPGWESFGNSPRGRYDQEVAHVDRQVGRLLEQLRATGQLERTIIVFTSDHGEEFGEHGGGHHSTLFDEVLRIPLLVSGPGVEPGGDERPCSQVDILPTVLGLLGIEHEPGMNLAGADLLATTTAAPRPIFAERDRPPRLRQRSVVLDGWKLTATSLVEEDDLSPERRKKLSRAGLGFQLYDLGSDPDEQRNLWDADNPKARLLMGLLGEHFAGGSAETAEVEVDEETRRQLESLGYVQ